MLDLVARNLADIVSGTESELCLTEAYAQALSNHQSAGASTG